MEGGATDCFFFLFLFLFLFVFPLLCLDKIGERRKGFKLFYLMPLVCFSFFSLSIFNFICAEVERNPCTVGDRRIDMQFENFHDDYNFFYCKWISYVSNECQDCLFSSYYLKKDKLGFYRQYKGQYYRQLRLPESQEAFNNTLKWKLGFNRIIHQKLAIQHSTHRTKKKKFDVMSLVIHKIS